MCGGRDGRLSSEQVDVGDFAETPLLFGPYRGLDFAYMGFLEQEHAQAALSDSAADRRGEFACKEA